MSVVIPIGDDLILRLPEIEDAEAIAQAAAENVGYVGRWLPWCTASYGVEDARAFIERGRESFAQRTGLPLILLERGRVIGGSGWTSWEDQDNPAWQLSCRTADIGYWLIEEAAGRGLMTRAVRALLDYGFTEHGLDRVTIYSEPENIKSCRVAERLGFKLEGTHRHVLTWKNRPVDHHVYAMLRDEWRGLTCD